MYNDSPEFCKTCPIENKNNKMKSVQVLLPFDIECGEDRVCNSNIHATVKLWGVRQVTLNVECNIEFLQAIYVYFNKNKI